MLKASFQSIAFIVIVCVFDSTKCLGQDSTKQIAVGLNYARLGSGDMDGILVNVDFIRHYSKRISVIYNLGFSSHGQRAYPGDLGYDPSIAADYQTVAPRWVTSGLQLSALFSFNFSKREYAGFNIAIGPVFRYQLNSYPDSYSYNPPQNPYNRQAYYVIKETDDNMFNLGYVIRIAYDFKPYKRNVFGVNFFYQNDTNGDLLGGFGLKYGFLFK